MSEVSLMIPTYNRVDVLMGSIESAQHQTLQDIDILVYDDGSTDGTADIVSDLAKQDKRITLKVAEHSGQEGVIRNALLKMVKTKYGMWQDSDDYSNAYRVEMMLDIFKKTNPSLLWCCVMAHRKPVGKLWEKFPFYSRKISRMVATTMFRMDKAVSYREDIWVGSDGVWANQMMERHGESMILPFMLYHVTYTRNDRMSVIWKDPRNREKYKDGVKIKKALVESSQKAMRIKGQDDKPQCVPEVLCHELLREKSGIDYPEYWKGI